MMQIDHLSCIHPDSLYYERPSFLTERGMEDTFGLSIPCDWRRQADAGWIHLIAPRTMPTQGWKVHVSTSLQDCEEILARTSEVCFRRVISFKHLPSVASVLDQNSKYAPRSGSGKFITIYPGSDDEFEGLLEALECSLAGYSGPYILSDVKYKRAPAFFRYGGFAAISFTAPDGTRGMGIRKPDGVIIEDQRQPVFSLPSFVQVPESVKQQVQQRVQPSDSEDNELLSAYQVDQPLHFSNGGGVYRATRKADGLKVVLKEGRRWAGLDGAGQSAYERVVKEADNLDSLELVQDVVRKHDLVFVEDHVFLVEGFIQGSSLLDWVAQNFPFSWEIPVDSYRSRALAILARIEALVASVHSSGMAIMDLQPRNIMVGAEDEVTLIDLETARPLSDTSQRAMATHGFDPTADCTNEERDHYCLAQVALHLFHPLTPLAFLAESVLQPQLKRILEQFGGDVAGEIKRLVRQADSAYNLHGERLVAAFPLGGPSIVDADHLAHELADGIEAGAVGRAESERIFRGDPAQFEEGGSTCLESGAAGIAIGLRRLGRDTSTADTWLSQQVPQGDQQLGLLRGSLGVAVYLAETGDLDSASQWLEHYRFVPWTEGDISLRTGIAGISLGLLALRAIAPDLIDPHEVETVGLKLAALVESPPTRLISPGSSTAEPIGLMDGWSGAALALLAIGRETGESCWISRAKALLRRDLDQLVTASDGSLQVSDRGRLLPYLSDGSAGVGYVICQLPADQIGPEEHEALRRIVRACRVRCTVEAGLFHGRAGLFALVASLPACEWGEGEINSLIDEQILALGTHFLRLEDSPGLLVPGQRNYRLSSDFGTGSAGVMASLASARTPGTSWLPIPDSALVDTKRLERSSA